MTAALYARISTHEGKQHAENQLRAMHEFVERRSWHAYAEYIDEASGSKSERNALKDLLSDAHAGRFDVVLVFALDRFTREGVFKAFRYVEQLRDCGVQFVSVTEPQFQTTGAMGEFFIAMAAWMARWERERIRERVKAGMARARVSGIRMGRRKAVLDTAKIKRWREQGKSWNDIVKLTGFKRTTIRRRMGE